MQVANLVLPVFAIIVTGWLAGWLGELNACRTAGVSPALLMHGPGGRDARGRASVRTRCQQGESPCVVVVTPRVAEGNCVAARRGGKQPEAKE